ncbi:26767_t:CDS:2 [Gigaspora margarita]|uniref:26767_t:CDS:1 n=1 Tax=Gigaspora margarita TaxID=4874 RepID=A0ABN7V3E0_GIGMA|nr:26767_t:CDS:2 [Gigaspora margarita]
MLLNSSPTFKIIVEQETITMHGTPQESAGNVLRGRLVLELCEVTKIKSIKLTFQGKSKVVWQGAPGNYNWGFELVLPGSLPETIAGCDHGSIEYKLKAIAERHSFALNLNTRQKITLQRCSFLNSEDALDTVVANTWTDRVVYDFSVDSKTLTLGDDISLSLDIKPLNQSLRVREYSCTFNECISYSVGTHKRSISKTLNSVRGDNLHWNDYLWTDSLKIKIPKSKTICHYDTDNSIIQITHELRLSIIFAVEDNRLVELRATLPIIITLNNDDMELPPYREFDPFNVNNVNSQRINELYEYVNISLPSYDNNQKE